MTFFARAENREFQPVYASLHFIFPLSPVPLPFHFPSHLLLRIPFPPHIELQGLWKTYGERLWFPAGTGRTWMPDRFWCILHFKYRRTLLEIATRKAYRTTQLWNHGRLFDCRG